MIYESHVTQRKLIKVTLEQWKTSAEKLKEKVVKWSGKPRRRRKKVKYKATTEKVNISFE